MEDWLVQYQDWCRLGCFVFFFVILSWAEKIYRWRFWITPRKLRIMRHLFLSLFSKVLIRLIFPVLTVGAAVYTKKQNIGLLHTTQWPLALQVVLAIIGLDLIMYLLHRIYHKYPVLWRFHRVHHIDRELDASTGIRFHPFEELFTMAVKMTGIAFLGAPALAVLLFEILLNFFTMFAHLNVQFKFKTEMVLRKLIITPGMHRIHHSAHPRETNSNFGFIFSWWDKFLGTYTLVSESGERKLAFGVEEYLAPKYQELETLLLLPFNLKRFRIKHKKKMKLKFKV